MHRTDGTAVTYEVINWELTSPLEHGPLAMLDHSSDLSDATLSASRRPTRTTGGNRRTLFEQTFEYWLEFPR